VKRPAGPPLTERAAPATARWISVSGTWAIEGCAGIGKHIATRLLADGEEVVDLPPKLSARARVFATGHGRKTDATDAHCVALVGTRMSGLRPVVNDEQLAVLRLLVDRRRWLGEDHTRMIAQLHQLLLELIPGGAKKNLCAAQAKALLAKVRPRDVAGKARRRVAAELVADLELVYRRSKEADKELKELVAATTLIDPHGIGPCGAAAAAGRGRRHHPLPQPGALRILQRHRPDRRLLRRPGPPPTLAGREPADQPGAAHHGHRAAPHADRRTCLRRPQEGPPRRPR
jgi:Transposase